MRTWSHGLLSLSSTDVLNDRRRVLNKRSIQPFSQEADTNHITDGSQLIKETTKTRTRVALELLVVAVAVVIPLSAYAGVFSDIFKEDVVVATPPPVTVLSGAGDIDLLSAEQNPDPLGGRGGAELIVDEHALVSTGPIGEDEMKAHSSNNGEIRVYTVREGDSLSEIAEMFDVTANTIRWANDLTKSAAIQPGDSLIILPIAGVRHTVKRGDTIASIAKKYEGNAEEIISYNELASAEDLSVGDLLIIPGGAMQAAPVTKSAKPTRITGGGGNGSAGFIHPAPGSVKSQGIHGYNGVDLAGSNGLAIRAAAGGEVIVAKGSGWNGGYGNYIVIRHNNGTQTLYAHLSSLNVGVGDVVGQGETIGGMGNTGRSTGTHLHFEVRGARNPF